MPPHDTAKTARRAPRSGARVVFSILWHADPRRIGARAVVDPAVTGTAADLSRSTPVFSDGEPLATTQVSRSPLQFVLHPSGSLQLWPGRDGLAFSVDGDVPGRGGEWLHADRLYLGARVRLGDGPLLLVQTAPWVVETWRKPGIGGSSLAMASIYAEIDTLGGSSAAVLIHGESGTGRSRLVRALHAASPRAAGPLVTVDLAVDSHAALPGAIDTARGGTLHVRSVECGSPESYALLLRADDARLVRLVGSTDAAPASLGTDEAERALLRRLVARSLAIPPLRDRPVDVASQAVQFLLAELAPLGAARHLEEEREQPWLGCDAMCSLLDAPWPGNSAQLARACAALAEAWAGSPTCGRLAGPA